ncbi:xanthine dehydrogenase family protein molybdopterin-binding subunit [candidate division KSB1 bacterium]|nr:xanthine dehydrogenase family protein molybdopterin-binding subunit [candidate division KSB1 bacterium]
MENPNIVDQELAEVLAAHAEKIVTKPVNRRTFIKTLGGGILILIAGPVKFVPELEARQRRMYPEDFNAYLRIAEDGRVTCFTGKIEMGQGIITSLAQEIAEELDVPLASIHMIMGDTEQCPWDMGTFGSMSTRFFGPALRAAGAKARAVLLELAAEKLNIAKNKLHVKDGFVFDTAQPENKVSYGQLAQGKAITRTLNEDAVVKSAQNYKIIGKPMNRLDAREKVTGKAKYAGDIQFPDMLYARILRPPSHESKRISVDTSPAEKMNGVQLLRDGDMIAVLHRHPDMAEKALDKIMVKWDTPDSSLNEKSIYDHLLKVAPEGKVIEETGDITRGCEASEEVFDTTFYNAYVAHAPMEPHTATAKFEGDKLTVWASTQTPFPTRDRIARSLNMAAENVRVITPFVGGGFGGKSASQQAVEAAQLAKLSGKPVQVAWTRAEEFFYDTYRPAAVLKVKSGLSKEGRITFWDYHVYFAGTRGSEVLYDIAVAKRTAYGDGWRGGDGVHPFAVGAWRAPANNSNTFARESQIDMMAAKAGMDPLTFRLQHLKDEKMIGVLKAAAKQFGWHGKKAPSGKGFGVACGTDAETHVAVMAEVDVDKKTGFVKVKRIVAAQDMGLVINPEGAKIQMEGCAMMGLGYALTEELHFNGGKITDLNFDTYELPKFSWLSKIETVLLDSGDPKPRGGGEPVIICMGAVIANAIFDACGARVLTLPMTQERVLAAMGA